jgi:hypothetical protein
MTTTATVHPKATDKLSAAETVEVRDVVRDQRTGDLEGVWTAEVPSRWVPASRLTLHS